MPEETLTGRERVLNALRHQETGHVPLDLGGTGGGYILNLIHNVQPDVPVDNLLSMINVV